ncbi:MAG: CooT family nickel-binding protein [Eubacteriales bacterium]|nr:CooT family nickel-binding protein [Eubacteriales bacterium]
MCLSTIYINKKDKDSILARDVARFRMEDGQWVFTDIIGSEYRFRGNITDADLTGGYVIVCDK